MMDELPRETLRRIVAKHGEKVLADPRKIESLLNDLCGGHRREINVLVAALEERVPRDLIAGSRAVPIDLLLSRLAKRLEEQTAMTADAARWAVESWALALSVASESDIQSRRVPHQPSTLPQPPAPGDAVHKQPGRTTNPTSPAPRPPTVSQPPPRPRAPIPPAASGAHPPTNRQPTPGPLQPRWGRVIRLPALPNSSTQATKSVFGRGWMIRGCLVAIVLLLILSAVVLVGVPYAISVMREVQREKNAEPPRFPKR